MELLISSSRLIAAGLSLLAVVELKIPPTPGYERAVANVSSISPERLERARLLTGAPSIAVGVQIISESEARERQVPSWVSGYAVADARTVVLIPARAVTYPHDGMEDLVVHEVTHLLIDAAAGGATVPRWFHEGVSMYAATGWRIEDTTRLTFSAWSSAPRSLGELDGSFRARYGSVAGAYAVSGAFVRYLIERRGERIVAPTLANVRAGQDFRTAFAAASGLSLDAAAEEFWREEMRWTRFVPILSSSLALWIGVTLLSFLAFRAKRRRDARRLAEWDQEESEIGSGDRDLLQ